MRVAIVGTGPIGLGYAALLHRDGHRPVLWSPRGTLPGPAARIEAAGLVEHHCEIPVAAGPAALAEAEAVIFALRGNGHRRAMQAAAPHLHGGQALIVSSHSSLGGLYLSRLLAERGERPLIACWATTVTAGPMSGGRVGIRMLRSEVDVATIPAARVEEGLAVSRALFGDRFKASGNLLAISLSNLNPPIHLANALLNFTRIEKAEDWENYAGITPGVARMIEALDIERLDIARRLGVTVRTAGEHYRKSFPGLPDGAGLHELAHAVAERRRGTSPGPKDTATRFITEDVPFGIAFMVALGRLCGVPVPVHQAGLVLADTIYGHDFGADNDLLPALDLEDGSLDRLRRRALDGWELPARGANANA